MPKRSRRKIISSAEPSQPATILGLEDSRFSDLYHFLLTESWPTLLAGIVLIFVAINSVFAIIYLIDRGIANARPGSFGDAFFFCKAPHDLKSSVMRTSCGSWTKRIRG